MCWYLGLASHWVQQFIANMLKASSLSFDCLDRTNSPAKFPFRCSIEAQGRIMFASVVRFSAIPFPSNLAMLMFIWTQTIRRLTPTSPRKSCSTRLKRCSEVFLLRRSYLILRSAFPQCHP